MGFKMGLEPSGSISGLKRDEHHGPGKENLKIAEEAQPNTLTDSELNAIDQVRSIFEKN